MGNKLVLILINLGFLWACQEQETIETGLTREVGDFKFLIQSAKPSNKNNEFLEYKLELKRNDDRDLISFEGTSAEVQSRIYYYSYRFKEDIYIQQDQSKIPVDFCHFERSFDMKKGRNFMLAFAKSKVDENHPFQIVVDSEVLATGPVKFKIAQINSL